MADVTTKTLNQLVQDQAAAVQSRAAGLVDYSIGAVLRAVGEAAAGVALWLQGLILVLLATTRASSSQTVDLDSFVADFGAAPTPADETAFARLPAIYATTQQTFSRLSTGSQVVVPVGSTVQTLDGSQKFAVIADPGVGIYSADLGGYIMAVGIASVNVPVRALTVGAQANVVAGALNTISSAIPGVSGTTNAASVSNGFDAEDDDALRVRFRSFVQSLRAGTPPALAFAVTSLARGVTCRVVENVHHDGTVEKGYSYLVVDDGTGYPSADLLTAAGVAVDAVHGAGTSFNVYAPTVVLIAIGANLVTVTGGDHAGAVAAAVLAAKNFLNTLPIGSPVYWSRVWQVLQDSHDDILEVTGLSVNGGAVDVAMVVYQVAKAGTVTIV